MLSQVSQEHKIAQVLNDFNPYRPAPGGRVPETFKINNHDAPKPTRQLQVP